VTTNQTRGVQQKVEEGLCIFFCFIVAQNHLCPVFFSLTKTSYLHLEKNYLELCTESVFFGWYWSVFLGIYHTDTEGKVGRYILVS